MKLDLLCLGVCLRTILVSYFLLFAFLFFNMAVFAQTSAVSQNFNCGDQISDYDGNTYNTVQIGSQCWMKENLKTTHYADGTIIPFVPDSAQWSFLSSSDIAYCYYDNDFANINLYGLLYTWPAVMNGNNSSDSIPSGVQGICPVGWHLPSDEEWKMLEGFTDSQFGYPDPYWNQTVWIGYDAGNKLKSTTGWLTNSGTDDFGFNGLPGGFRFNDGSFQHAMEYAYFWSSTEQSGNVVWYHGLGHNTLGAIAHSTGHNDYAMSIRCVYGGNSILADFSVSDTLVFPGDSIYFIDLSLGNPTSWFWDFGDGSSDTIQNPAHIYQYPGIFSVSLVVQNSSFCDTIIMTNFISVQQAQSCLVAYYPFNANANDESGYGNNGVVSGSILAPDRFGNSNSAFYFDGIDDYISFGNDSSINPETAITISVWVYFDQYPNNWDAIVNKYDSYILQFHNSHGIMVSFLDGDFKGFKRNVPIQNDLNTGEWNHIVAVYDETTSVCCLYLNGQNMIVVPRQAGWPSGINYGNQELTVGNELYYNACFFNGRIDDIRIFNCAISQIEILNLYHEYGWPGLLVNFSVSDTVISVGDSIQFSDLSTGNPTTWQWDFGDGISSFLQNPVHEYQSVGTYTVTLIAGDGTHFDTISYQDLVEVQALPQLQQFVEQVGINFPGLVGQYANIAVDFGDYDNDNDLDLILSGIKGGSPPKLSKLYKNNGNNSFSEDLSITIEPLSDPSAQWGDIDNDGWLDLVVTGMTSSGGINVCKVYQNDGTGHLAERSMPLQSVYCGSAEWGDLDNDGDQDVLLTGDYASTIRLTKLYINNGMDSLIDQTPANIYGAGGELAMGGSSGLWADYDNDMDMDFFIGGYKYVGGTDPHRRVGRIYTNNGNNSYSEIPAFNPDLFVSSAAWADYNQDGLLDLIVSGKDSIDVNYTILYKNMGNNMFAEQYTGSFMGVRHSSASWGDYDNDGDFDLLLTGDSGNGYRTKVYQNNLISFEEDTSVTLPNIFKGRGVWTDYDNDGDLDILLSGSTGSGKITKLYKNYSAIANQPPSVPDNLQSIVSDSTVYLSWNTSSDDHSVSSILSYNIYLIKLGGDTVVSPLSDISTGFRKVVRMGNTNLNTSWYITNLDTGIYYWSVQAIDACYKGSEFAESEWFNIGQVQQDSVVADFIVSDTSIMLGDTIQFSDLSTGNPTGWHWDFGDSITSTNQDPIHVYEGGGLFTVKLVAWNGQSIDSLSKMDYIYVDPTATQVIDLSQGWSIMSTYIEPYEPDMDSIFSDIVTYVIIAKNGIGQVYWPAYNLNMIGDIANGEGYQIKMVLAKQLTITGLRLDPENTPIELLGEWHLIAYLHPVPQNIELMLSPIFSNLIIAKNGYGLVYWPMFGLNIIGDMIPGEGYQIKITQNCTLVYPPVNGSKKK